jgi:hypothetical protein
VCMWRRKAKSKVGNYLQAAVDPFIHSFAFEESSTPCGVQKASTDLQYSYNII